MDTRHTTSHRPGVMPGDDVRASDGPAAGRDVPDIRSPAERAAVRDERSIGDLIKELRDETTTLMRQEIALARTEMSEKASRAARNSAYVGVGAVMGYLGLLFGLVALTVGLALILGRFNLNWHAWWIAPLVVGAIVGGIGYAIVSKGLKTLKHESIVPEKTVQSLQEDKQWLQDKVTR